MAKRIWLLQAEDKIVPGRITEAHETRDSARASARDLRKAHGETLAYCDVWLVAVSPRPDAVA